MRATPLQSVLIVLMHFSIDILMQERPCRQQNLVYQSIHFKRECGEIVYLPYMVTRLPLKEYQILIQEER